MSPAKILLQFSGISRQIGCTDNEVSLTRKSIQCNAKINIAAVVKDGEFYSCQPDKC